MSENSDALENAYEAFNSGDAATVAALYADDVTWEGPTTEGLPMSGKTEGKDGVMQALGQFGELYESFEVSPDEMLEAGDTIVVLSHVNARTRSGKDFEYPSVEVWRFGADGKVTRVQSLADTAQIKEALA